MKIAGTLLFTAFASTSAIAHGNSLHDEGRQSDTLRKEQKRWGIASAASAATRSIEVELGDNMRFTPDFIQARQGETIRFVIANSGRVMHEFVLGTKRDLEAHAALMRQYPDMEHDEPYMAHVAPKRSREIVWTFNRAGEFYFACLIPGHYESGMVGKVSVGTDGSAPIAKAPAGNGNGGETASHARNAPSTKTARGLAPASRPAGKITEM